MDIALAQTFLMVADTGSFVDAARKLNITQSTVSARIKTLEELFGRPLFERFVKVTDNRLRRLPRPRLRRSACRD